MRGRFKGNRSTRRLRKQSRTIPIWGSLERGDGEDNGKYFRCWNCGFICNVERDMLGDSQSGDGTVLEDYNPAENKVTRNMGVGASGDITIAYINEPDRSIYGSLAIDKKSASIDGLVAGEQDSAGDNRKVLHPLRVSEKSRGCPLCHTLNWRGDYP